MHVQLATKEPNGESKKITFSQESRLTTFPKIQKQDSQIGILLLKSLLPMRRNKTLHLDLFILVHEKNPTIQSHKTFQNLFKQNQVIPRKTCMKVTNHKIPAAIIDSIEDNIEFNGMSFDHRPKDQHIGTLISLTKVPSIAYQNTGIIGPFKQQSQNIVNEK